MCIRRDVVFLIVQEDDAGVVDMKIPERARIVQSAYQESKLNVNYVHPFLAYLLTPSYLPTVPTYISMAHHTHLQAPHVVYPKKKKHGIKRPRAHLSALETPPR